jgi:hypothetical protein
MHDDEREELMPLVNDFADQPDDEEIEETDTLEEGVTPEETEEEGEDDYMASMLEEKYANGEYSY